MRLKRSLWRAFLAVLLVVLPLTAVVIVPAVGAVDPMLYDQSAGGDGEYWFSNDYLEVLAAGYDENIADDFVVPSDRVWSLTQVTAYGLAVPGFSNPASFNVFIYANTASKPGAVIWSASGLAYTTAAGGKYDIPLAGVPDLYEGTYWISVQANSSTVAGTAWAWASKATQVNTAAQYQNPGNARATGCTTWGRRDLCQFTGGGGPSGYDELFTLYGLDLANDPPVNTVPGAQTVVDNVNLTFNAANSNAISVADPDAQNDNLQVTLKVTHGILTIAPGSGVNLGCGGCGGNNTAMVVFRGKLSEINAALNGLVYNPTDGFGGPDTLTITTDDRGNNGTGGAQSDTDTVAITVRARTVLTVNPGTMQYGGSGANLSACLDTVATTDPATDLSGQTIVFKVDGNTIATATTNASGCATFTGDATNPGLNAGTYTNRLEGDFAGSTYLLPANDTANLTIARRIIWIKPIDRTVGFQQPNPSATAPAGCAAADDPTQDGPYCWLELTNGSSFVPGEDWTALDLARLRFQYARNYPTSNSTEYVGKTYRISASGVISRDFDPTPAVTNNYDVRYKTGTLTVVP